MQLNYNELRDVNLQVNELVKYESDSDKYLRADYWESALDSGDCEDYAIAKLRILLGQGWPREKLKLAICKVETGEYHCVLVATDADGEDWVLDNRASMPTRWEEMPYTWDRFYLLGERVWRLAA